MNFPDELPAQIENSALWKKGPGVGADDGSIKINQVCKVDMGNKKPCCPATDVALFHFCLSPCCIIEIV